VAWDAGSPLAYPALPRWLSRISGRRGLFLSLGCRRSMARAAVGWGVRELARAAKASPDTISRLERGELLKERTLDAVRAALEAAGRRVFDG
jgi:hypothetical protein